MSKVQIYGVSVFGNRVDVESTMATITTNGTTVKVGERLAAFHYNIRIANEDAHLTPDAALEAFIVERTAKRDEHWRQIGILNGQCEQARSMIGAKS